MMTKSLLISLGVVGHTGLSGLVLGGGIGWLCRFVPWCILFPSKHFTLIWLYIYIYIYIYISGAMGFHVITFSLLTWWLPKGSCWLLTKTVTLYAHYHVLWYWELLIIHSQCFSVKELFWAIKGAGTSFGVITSFKLKCHPLPGPLFAGPLVFPWNRCRENLLSRIDNSLCNVDINIRYTEVANKYTELSSTPEQFPDQLSVYLVCEPVVMRLYIFEPGQAVVLTS